MEPLNYISMVLNSQPAHIIAPGNRDHASVALIMADVPDGPSILLIERSTNESDYWSGQIGLPGGRSEACDKSPRHTAERETREEVGLDLAAAHFLGRLNDIAPGGLNIVVSCFVYAVRCYPVLCPDRDEIADTFWVPVREFINPARLTYVDFKVQGRLRRFPALKIGVDIKQPLWGITYRLLRNFDKAITANVPEIPVELCHWLRDRGR